MELNKDRQKWDDYTKRELNGVLSYLTNKGYALEKEQVHIGGERYLFSEKKLVLIGYQISDKKRIIIKVSSDFTGIKEIEDERNARNIIGNIHFAYHTFQAPKELLFTKYKNYTIAITTFIEQDIPFLKRSLQDQFFLTLKAFAVQEGVHAITSEHTKVIRNTFGTTTPLQYLKNFAAFKTDILSLQPNNQKLKETLKNALALLVTEQSTIALYAGFLTHTDFVPHNIRLSGNDIYLLDHSSIRFGNKYEGWGRFLNFMTLYNPELEQYLMDYIRTNRGDSEYLSLRTMRVYRLGELIRHYTRMLNKSSGNILTLTEKRITFWMNVLQSVLHDTKLQEKTLTEFTLARDGLRSKEEKKRQQELHWK